MSDFVDPLGRTLFETHRPSGEVELEVAPGQYVCDFCLDPHPTWQYECGLVAVVGNHNIDASDDPWLACERCHELIEAGSLPALISRMVAGQSAAVSAAAVPGVELPPRRIRVANARTNVSAFIRAKRGEPRPFSQ